MLKAIDAAAGGALSDAAGNASGSEAAGGR